MAPSFSFKMQFSDLLSKITFCKFSFNNHNKTNDIPNRTQVRPPIPSLFYKNTVMLFIFGTWNGIEVRVKIETQIF